jgi:hypothetical protein
MTVCLFLSDNRFRSDRAWRLIYASALVLVFSCSNTSSPESDADASQKHDTAAEPSADASVVLPPELLAACPDAKFKSTSGAKVCTLIACMDGLNISTFPESAWPHGKYKFVVNVDDQPVTCTGSLPLLSCAGRSISCDRTGVSIGESGCALPADNQSFYGINFTGYPRAVHVDVFYNDVSVASAYYEPSYRYSQPNGPGCDPVCCFASAKLTLDFSLAAP